MNKEEIMILLGKLSFTLNGTELLTEVTDALNELFEYKQDKIEEKYVIYCTNNFHNIYMDYRGKPCNYQEATIFNNKFEAHKFLREKGTDNYYYWSVFNVKDLEEGQKHRRD